MWTEILWQTKKNGDAAGLGTIADTVWRDGVPMIILAIYPAFVCKICGRWNHGNSCHNESCKNFGVEVNELKPQAN